MSGTAGTLTGYRDRTYQLVRGSIQALGHIDSAIDVGAGDGWYARSLTDDRLIDRCTPVDVARRARTFVEPVLYDGVRLPFDDHAVELVYAVDVVHHAPDPLALLDEMARVARRFIVLKDHTCTTPLGRLTLKTLDEVGNRRFGVSSPGTYQHGWTWLDHLRQRGFTVRHIIHPAPVHRSILGALTNGLQFVTALERTP